MPKLWRFLIVLLAAWVLLNLSETVRYILADYSQIPVADYWREIQLWAQPGAILWSNLWAQHNEHRIVFPELAYIADMLLLHGRMYLPIALSGACYAGVWGVLAWAAYSESAIESPSRELGLLLAAIVLTWKGCSTVIATPFQLAFTLTQLMASLALAFMMLACQTRRWTYLVATIAAACIATYSVGNGMLIWPVLIFIAVLLRMGGLRIAILTLSAISFLGLYFAGYHRLPSQISSNVRHPLHAISFLGSYFSMPFGGYGPRTYGFKVGALNLILMTGCTLAAWRRGILRSRLSIVLFGTYLFILISAVLTTLGRMDLNDYLFTQAKAWRYVTMPTLSWALLAMALVWLAGTAGIRHLAGVVSIVIAALFYFGFKNASDWVETTRLDSANGQVTATMLRDSVFDPEQVRTIFPDPNFVEVFARVMQRNHKSIYAHGNDHWVGGDLLSLPVQNKPVAGKITRVRPVPGGLEILGWADNRSLTSDHEILFVDKQNTIAGFGRRPAAGLPANLSAWDTPNQLAFVGYVSLANPVDILSVYVRTFHGKSVQPLDQKIAVPAFTQLASKADGAILPGIFWQTDANWTVGGYTVDPENGPAPSGTIYGSWSGSDAKTGKLHTQPFATPINNCLVLPVLHGRASYGQSVEVRDADTQQTIAALPFLDGRTIWERWRIPIPAATHHVAILADDEGTGPNQWLAVAAPEQCQ
jgi:hypothetical protein